MGSGNLAYKITSVPVDESLLEVFRDVGQTLTTARREHNLSISQVAAKIHIRQRYLSDLEEGRLSDLPGRVYILGFVRTYARFLNLDGEELVRRLNILPNLLDHERCQVPAPMSLEEVEPTFTVVMVSVGIVLSVIIGGYIFLRLYAKEPVFDELSLTKETIIQPTEEKSSPDISEEKGLVESLFEESSSFNKTEENVKETSEDQLSANAEASISQSTPLITAQDQSKIGSSVLAKKVILKAVETTWVEIRDHENHVLFMKVLQPGEEYTLPDKTGVRLSTGNAGGLEIFVRDRKLPLLGRHGEVKRDIMCDSFQ